MGRGWRLQIPTGMDMGSAFPAPPWPVANPIVDNEHCVIELEEIKSNI